MSRPLCAWLGHLEAFWAHGIRRGAPPSAGIRTGLDTVLRCAPQLLRMLAYRWPRGDCMPGAVDSVLLPDGGGGRRGWKDGLAGELVGVVYLPSHQRHAEGIVGVVGLYLACGVY
jgi:hypothetical protein